MLTYAPDDRQTLDDCMEMIQLAQTELEGKEATAKAFDCLTFCFAYRIEYLSSEHRLFICEMPHK